MVGEVSDASDAAMGATRGGLQCLVFVCGRRGDGDETEEGVEDDVAAVAELDVVEDLRPDAVVTSLG